MARLRTKLARLRTKLARKTGRVQAGATTTHTKIVLQTHLDTMDMMLWRNSVIGCLQLNTTTQQLLHTIRLGTMGDLYYNML